MNAIGRQQLEGALTALGELLMARGLHYEVVLVGGGNLILRELIARPTTRDLDLLGEWTSGGVAPMRPMPKPLRDAVVDVGRAFGLADDWLNTGPDSLLDLGLPDGFVSVSSAAISAASWRGSPAGSTWSASSSMPPVDQGPRSRHFQDLRDLRPGRVDLFEAARWAMGHDPSPGFRSLLVDTLRALDIEDADASLG